LQDQSWSNVAHVVAQLQNNAAAIHANSLPSGTMLGGNINSGSKLAAVFGDPTSSDPVASARAPNVVIQPNAGVIYSGSSKKIAEHGGGTIDDTNVALMVSLPSINPRAVSRPISTTQIAPTILRALHLSPRSLDAVRIEGTMPLQEIP